MAWRSKPENSGTRRDTIENILGKSCTIRGDLSADGAFRIDGTIEGSVTSRAAVVIGESGVVRGCVSGCDIVVAGRIQGDVVCSGHLEILAKGKVEGDIDAQSMRIETGGVFRGTSRMGKSEAATQPATTEAEAEVEGKEREAPVAASEEAHSFSSAA
ncbi:MAG TPA: polymer-forming cytoskeletal protein [Polyangia bacterium]|jgi:cytoskeletal protein CcmA (bactofilin family)